MKCALADLEQSLDLRGRRLPPGSRDRFSELLQARPRLRYMPTLLPKLRDVHPDLNRGRASRHALPRRHRPVPLSCRAPEPRQRIRGPGPRRRHPSQKPNTSHTLPHLIPPARPAASPTPRSGPPGRSPDNGHRLPPFPPPVRTSSMTPPAPPEFASRYAAARASARRVYSSRGQLPADPISGALPPPLITRQ